MVLGLRSKKKKGSSVHIDCVVHIEEIKPWPPSESLRSVQSVLLQWQNGDQNSGSFITVARAENILFDESFTLNLILHRDKKARDKFQKNFLEFGLYEPRKDKGTKGQLLGRATINLADYGVFENALAITVPINCKKSSKSSVQPTLFVQIEPLDKASSRSSPSIMSSRTSIDGDVQESLADFDGDDSEIVSFTDDDISSHSSQKIASSTFEAARSSPSQSDKNGRELVNEIAGRDQQQSDGSLPPMPSVILSSDMGHPLNNHKSKSKFPERSMTSVQRKSFVPFLQSSSSFIGHRDMNGKSKSYINHLEQGAEIHSGFYKEGNTEVAQLVKDERTGRVAEKVASLTTSIRAGLQSNVTNYESSQERKGSGAEAKILDDEYAYLMSDDEEEEQQHFDAIQRQSKMKNASSIRKARGVQNSNGRLKHVKSQLYDPAGRNEVFDNSYSTEKASKIHVTDGAGSSTKTTPESKEHSDELPDGKARNTAGAERKELANEISELKVEWLSRIKMLEEELREAATLEVGLYSVVAEHGSSMNKVHAPARRLSRFYLHACKANSRSQKASAARAIASGLVLVSKACGNDVPRLTFWLSNAIMLRAIMSQAAAEVPHSDRPHTGKSNGFLSVSDSRSPRKRDECSSIEVDSTEEYFGWEDTDTFLFALERTESWIFSRIVESIWWQTLTPHMLPTVAKASGKTSTKKSNASRYGLGDQEQGNFSVELWKKAFRDACERICPIRAEGHECGCLPVLARLVMEQLVIRLDVAMFNAILRESAEEMPSDPLSDPISEPKVLPIVAGKLSFGAGAQLKNAIGNWSRWLSDLFEIEDNYSPEDNSILTDDKAPESFKAFCLLNALSDIMMLPFEMLTDRSTRKEVCPALGPMLIRKVLSNFVPDQFCPYPIPESVIDALDCEDELDVSAESVSVHPCTAPPTVYSPPSVTSLTGFMREVGNHTVQRSGSSLLKKSYTSDDELDEMDTRLTCVFTDSFRNSAPTKLNLIPKGSGSGKVSRYELLREVWKDYEQ